MKILVIDDEPGILEVYSDKIKSEGMEVISANNGAAGLELAKSQLPDLILLDIIMPKLNGLDVLKSIKADDTIKNIPVILLTNLPAEMSADKARELGAKDYLVKAEYDPVTVVDIIKKALVSDSNQSNPPPSPA